MAAKCEVCGKKPSFGNNRSHSMVATKRRFNPNLQKVRIDEEDETDELASLSESAEALRLTAAAPPRPTPSGGDYE